MRGNTVAIHSILKKKTIKLNSQPTQNLKNKINKKILKKTKKTIKKEEDNFGKKKQMGNKTCGES
jgi:hypothetical protein